MEIIDLYDENKNLTGEKIKRGEPIPEGKYKLSIHIWIVNESEKVYIQKRASTRKIFPSLWENPGGGAITGDSSKDAFEREFCEELGLKPELVNAFLFKTIKRERDFVDLWFIKQDFDISNLNLQKEEVSQAKWATIQQINNMIDKGLFCPTFKESYLPFLEFYLNFSKDKNK